MKSQNREILKDFIFEIWNKRMRWKSVTKRVMRDGLHQQLLVSGEYITLYIFGIQTSVLHTDTSLTYRYQSYVQQCQTQLLFVKSEQSPSTVPGVRSLSSVINKIRHDQRKSDETCTIVTIRQVVTQCSASMVSKRNGE